MGNKTQQYRKRKENKRETQNVHIRLKTNALPDENSWKTESNESDVNKP